MGFAVTELKAYALLASLDETLAKKAIETLRESLSLGLAKLNVDTVGEILAR